MKISNHTVVSLRYIMCNSNGDVLENTMQAAPVTYLHGSAGILLFLQQQLQGLQRGNNVNVMVNKECGAPAGFLFEVTIDDVRAALPEEIALGYPLPTVVASCNEDCDCYC